LKSGGTTKEGCADATGQLDCGKPCGRVQVVLAALIDDAKIPCDRGPAIRDDAVDLVQLRRYALRFTPPARAIEFTKPLEIPDTPADGDRVDASDLTISKGIGHASRPNAAACQCDGSYTV
jgi:hypothetical protein